MASTSKDPFHPLGLPTERNNSWGEVWGCKTFWDILFIVCLIAINSNLDYLFRSIPFPENCHLNNCNSYLMHFYRKLSVQLSFNWILSACFVSPNSELSLNPKETVVPHCQGAWKIQLFRGEKKTGMIQEPWKDPQLFRKKTTHQKVKKKNTPPEPWIYRSWFWCVAGYMEYIGACLKGLWKSALNKKKQEKVMVWKTKWMQIIKCCPCYFKHTLFTKIWQEL